jgi:hypothetical protein
MMSFNWHFNAEERNNAEGVATAAAYTYVFTADDRSLTSAGVVRAAILVDAPIAGPLSFDTRRARCVTGAVVIGKVTADEILVGLRGSHLEEITVGSSLSSSHYPGNNKYGYGKDTHTHTLSRLEFHGSKIRAHHLLASVGTTARFAFVLKCQRGKTEPHDSRGGGSATGKKENN